MTLRLRGLIFAFAATLGATVCAGISAASAQSAPFTNLGLAQQTSTALSEAMKSRHDAQAERNYLAASPTAEDTPPPPVSDSEGEVIGFPKGITYGIDLSSSYAYGDTGEPRNGLPGGFDFSITARLEPRTNAFVQYYQLEPQILGVDTGSAPLYNAGSGTPTGQIPLSTLNYHISTKIDAAIAGLQRLFFVGGAAINGGHPIIFAPTYAAVKADIGGGYLNFQTQYNNGQVLTVQQRVFQQFSANLVIPFSLTEKLYVLYFATPEILLHPQGFNQTNHVQFEQQLLAEYNPNKLTTFFFNPSRALTYFPTDLYPESTFSIAYGVVHRFGKPNKLRLQPFIQGEVITSNPDNNNGLGVKAITAVPGVGILPTLGGNKFTTVQLSVGVGTPPLVIPYP